MGINNLWAVLWLAFVLSVTTSLTSQKKDPDDKKCGTASASCQQKGAGADRPLGGEGDTSKGTKGTKGGKGGSGREGNAKSSKGKGSKKGEATRPGEAADKK